MDFLKKIDLFKGLTDEELKKFIKITKEKKFSAGEYIIREGEVGTSIFILKEGEVEVSKNLYPGFESCLLTSQEKILTRLGPKDHPIFGEISLLDEGVRTANTIAVTECTLLYVNRKDFLQLINRDKQLGFKLIFNLGKLLCSRLRKADDDTVKLSTALCLALSKQ